MTWLGFTAGAATATTPEQARQWLACVPPPTPHEHASFCLRLFVADSNDDEEEGLLELEWVCVVDSLLPPSSTSLHRNKTFPCEYEPRPARMRRRHSAPASTSSSAASNRFFVDVSTANCRVLNDDGGGGRVMEIGLSAATSVPLTTLVELPCGDSFPHAFVKFKNHAGVLSVPLLDPASNTTAYVCLPGHEHNLVRLVWRQHSCNRLREEDDDVWAGVWACVALFYSTTHGNGDRRFSSTLSLEALMGTLIDCALAHQQQQQQHGSRGAVAVRFVCASLAALQSTQQDNNNTRRHTQSCAQVCRLLPLLAEAEEDGGGSVMALRRTFGGNSLPHKHVGRMLHAGLRALIQFDAATLPACSFAAAVPCAQWLDRVFPSSSFSSSSSTTAHALLRSVAKASTAGTVTVADSSRRDSSSSAAALLDQVDALPLAITFQAAQKLVRAVVHEIAQQEAALGRRADALNALCRSLDLVVDDQAGESVTTTAAAGQLSASVDQIVHVVEHLTRRAADIKQFFAQAGGRAALMGKVEPTLTAGLTFSSAREKHQLPAFVQIGLTSGYGGKSTSRESAPQMACFTLGQQVVVGVATSRQTIDLINTSSSSTTRSIHIKDITGLSRFPAVLCGIASCTSRSDHFLLCFHDVLNLPPPPSSQLPAGNKQRDGGILYGKSMGPSSSSSASSPGNFYLARVRLQEAEGGQVSSSADFTKCRLVATCCVALRGLPVPDSTADSSSSGGEARTVNMCEFRAADETAAVLIAPCYINSLFLYATTTSSTTGDVRPTAVVNASRTMQDADGPANEASLSYPVGALTYHAASDSVFFASSRATSLLSLAIRSVSSAGVVRTVATWSASDGATAKALTSPRPSALWFEEASGGGAHVLYAAMPHRRQIVAFAPSSSSSSFSTTAEYAALSVPLHMTANRDGQLGQYFCLLGGEEDAGGGGGLQLCSVSSGACEAAARRQWAGELEAWTAEVGEFQQLARDAVQSMTLRSSAMADTQHAQVLPMLDERVSKSFWDAVRGLLVNAPATEHFDYLLDVCPTLSDAAGLWRRWHEGGVASSLSSSSVARFNAWIEAYAWPERLVESDVASLVQLLAPRASSPVVTGKTVAGVLDSKLFAAATASRSSGGALLLGLHLLQAALTMDTNALFHEQLRMPAVHWLARIDANSAAPRPLPVFALLKRALAYWDEILPSMLLGEVAELMHAMEWLVVAHLRTLCARRVSALKALAHLLQEEETAGVVATTTARQVARRNLARVHGGADSSFPLGPALRGALVDRVGVLACTLWFAEPHFTFLSSGALPSSSSTASSCVLMEPSCEAAAAASVVMSATGTFEIAASGTFLFAWSGPSGASSALGMMWLALSQVGGGKPSSSSSSGSLEFKQAKLNQWAAFELTEGEYAVHLKAFSKTTPGARLVVEGPYTPQTALHRMNMPNAAKRVAYPLAAALYAPSSSSSSSSSSSYGTVGGDIAASLVLKYAQLEEDKKQQQSDHHHEQHHAAATLYPSVLSSKRQLTASKAVDELLDLGAEACLILVQHFAAPQEKNPSPVGEEFPALIARLESNLGVMSRMAHDGELTWQHMERMGLKSSAFAQAMCCQGGGGGDALSVERLVGQSLAEAQALAKQLERLSRVLSALLSNNDIDDHGARLVRDWADAALRAVKRTPLTELRRLVNVQLAPALRAADGEALVFVEKHCHNVVFKRLWAVCDAADASSSIERQQQQLQLQVGHTLGAHADRVRHEQARIRAALLTGELTWGEMEHRLELPLLDQHHRELWSAVSDFFFVQHKSEELARVRGGLEAFQLAWFTLRRWKEAEACVYALAPLVDDNSASSAASALGALLQHRGHTLQSKEDDGSLASMPLTAISMFMSSRDGQEQQVLPRVLFALPEALAGALGQSLPLFQWLRKTPRDQEFAALVEMSFTKPELEVPHELWSNAKNSVDEEILSSLTDVRAALHPLVFGITSGNGSVTAAASSPALLPAASFAALFDCIEACELEVSLSLQQLTRQLEQVNAKRRPLMQLLSGGDDGGGVESYNQLLFLQSRHAEWVVVAVSSSSSSSSSGAHTGVSMRYRLQHDGNYNSTAAAEYKILDRELLADLQSTLVLGNDDGDARGDDFVADLASSFVEELCLLDVMGACVNKLAAAGHLCFQPQGDDNAIVVPFGAAASSGEDGGVERFRRAAQELEALAEVWPGQFAQFRDEFPALSCFSNRQIVDMTLTLAETAIPTAGELLALTTMSRVAAATTAVAAADNKAIGIIHSRDPDAGEACAQRVWEACRARWTGGNGNSNTPLAALESFGRAMSGALTEHAPGVTRRRVSEVPMPTQPPAPDEATRVRVVRVQESKLVDSALTAYAALGLFPTRHDCLFVSPFVALDSALNLARRWANAAENGDLYCLIAAHQLSFEHQRALGKFLERYNNSTTTSKRGVAQFLLIVSEECAIESMFSGVANGGRMAQVLLPLTKLRAYVGASLLARQVTAKTFASRVPGQGKTFAIRTLAAHAHNGDDELHVLRINALDRSSLAAIVDNLDGAVDARQVHVDVSDSACRSHSALVLTALLFDLVFLNGLVMDESSSMWAGPRTFYVEMPAGAPQTRRVRIARLLDFVMVEPSADTFMAGLEDLRIGMGQEEFASARCDGTV